MKTVKIGKITAPVGIRGEVRVYPFTDETTRFSQISAVLIEKRCHELQNVRYQKDKVILKLSEVDDRNTAESLRGKELFLPEESLWDIPEDTYFVRDLIGMTVRTQEGTLVGELTDVIHHSHQDLYEITDRSGHPFLLPAVGAFVLDVNLPARTMTVRLIEGMTDS